MVMCLLCVGSSHPKNLVSNQFQASESGWYQLLHVNMNQGIPPAKHSSTHPTQLKVCESVSGVPAKHHIMTSAIGALAATLGQYSSRITFP